MRGVAVAIVAMLSTTAAQAQDDENIDCKNAMVQHDMNVCSDRDFQAADRTLNNTYKAVMARLDERGRGKLRAEERNWIVRRDKQCKAEAAPESGGSIYPMVYSECLIDQTNARVKELQAK